MQIDEKIREECKKNPKINLFDFPWPGKEELKIFIKDILESEPVDPKYYLKPNQVEKLIEGIKKKMESKQKNEIDKINLNGHQSGDVHNVEGIMSTLNAVHYKEPPKIYSVEWDLNKDGLSSQSNRAYSVDGVPCCLQTGLKPNIFMVNTQPRSENRPSLVNGTSQGGSGVIWKEDGTTYCLDTGNTQADCLSENITPEVYQVQLPHGTNPGHLKKADISPSISKSSWEHNNPIIQNGIFRRLTPKECFRLQGFLNDEINLKGLSDTQCYKLAGNGQTVTVVEKIFRQMFKEEIDENPHK